MSSHAPAALTATAALRRPRVVPLLTRTAYLLASCLSSAWTCTRRHHNSRPFSTAAHRHCHRGAPAHLPHTPLTGPSLAVRLLQPSSTTELPQVCVPAAAARGGLSAVPAAPSCSSPQQQQQVPTRPAQSPLAGTPCRELPSGWPSPLPSFPAEFVHAYWGSLTQGLQLGLRLAERDSMRSRALSDWLQTRNARRPLTESDTRTPFAMPPFRIIMHCLREECEATAAAFFSFPLSAAAPSGGGGDGTEQRLHTAAWHTFCLKSLLGAAVRSVQRDAAGLREEADNVVGVGGRGGVNGTEEWGQQIQQAFVRLLAHTSVPSGVLDTLLPIAAMAARTEKEQWAWRAEMAALSSRRADVWNPAGLAEHVAELEQHDMDAWAIWRPSWLQDSVALRKDEQRPRPWQQARSRPSRHRGEQQQQRCEQEGPTEGGDGASLSPWAVLENMWSSRFGPLIAAAAQTLEREAMPADVALATHCRRLREQLAKCVPRAAGAAAMPSQHAAMAFLLGNCPLTVPLAELAAFLLGMATADERAGVCEAVSAQSGGAPFRLAAIIPRDSWVLPLLEDALCADAARGSSHTAAGRLLAQVVAATGSTRLLERAIVAHRGASRAEREKDEWSERALAFLTDVGIALSQSPDMDTPVSCKCTAELAAILLAHWDATDAARNRHYRFPPTIARAVWAAFVPLACRMGAPPHPVPGSEQSSELPARVLAVCLGLSLVWDAAVCPPRQQHRRLARQPPATAALSTEVGKVIVRLADRGAADCAHSDYAAPAPIPQRTEAFAQLLLTLLGDGHTAVRCPVPDSATFSRLCSAALIVLREVDAASAEAMVAGLDQQAFALLERGKLDTRAALAMLRCVAAPRFGCHAPYLAVLYFDTAIALDGAPRAEGCDDALESHRESWSKGVDWPGEAARVLGCLAHSAPLWSHTERCAALMHFAAHLCASGIELNVAARTTLQQGFVTQGGHGGRSAIFSRAPWSDPEGQYRAWLSEEEHTRLLLHLPALQLCCARSLLALGRWKVARTYLPSADMEGIAKQVLCAVPVREREELRRSGRLREIATHHALLYLCSTDVTRSSGASGRALAAHLLSVSPEPVKTRFWAVWQRWYRASRAVAAAPLPPPPSHAARAHRGTLPPPAVCFRPFAGQRFIPSQPEPLDREAELRMRFTKAGEPSLLARYCETMHRCSAAKSSQAAARPPPHDVDVSTSYVGVAAALRSRSV